MAVLLLPVTAQAQTTVSGGLVSNGLYPESGTGIGSENTILSLQTQNGQVTTESGCVSPSGTTGCGFEDNVVKPGTSHTGVFLTSLAGINGSNLAVVLDFGEPGGALEGQVDQLVLTLYNDAGMALFSTNLANPVFFESTVPGTGSSGFLFSLTPTAASAFDLAAANGGTQLGLGASLSQVSGDQETFFIGISGSAITTTPEPASLVLLGTGLVGVFGAVRRRRTVA